MVKAVRIHEYGGPENLRYEDVEIGDPGPGQAYVRHTAIGLNFADTHNREGRYPMPSLPHVLGGEAAGVVEKVGPGVTEVKPRQDLVVVMGKPLLVHLVPKVQLVQLALLGPEVPCLLVQ